MNSADKTIELLNGIVADKQNLVDTLITKGKTASMSDSFDSLIQKADDLIIEVTELPAEGVEGSLYRCDGKLYEWVSREVFSDILYAYNDSRTGSFTVDIWGDHYPQSHFYKIATTPDDPESEGINVSTDIDTAHWYYIEDINDILVYTSVDGTNSWVSFGTIGSETTMCKGRISIPFDNEALELIDTNGVDCYYAAFSTAFSWKSYGYPYIIDVSSLPTENVITDAIYRVLEEKCTDVGIYNDDGEYVSIVALLSAFLGVPVNIFNVESLDSVENPQPSPAAWYYCRADHKLYGYKADEGVWDAADGQDEDSIATPGWQLAEDYAYYKPQTGGFTDIVLVEGSTRMSMKDMYGDRAHFHTIPTLPDEAPAEVSVAGENEMHFYYIEDARDVGTYNLNEETSLYEWRSVNAEIDADFKGFIADMSEATENGIYAVISSGWEKHIRPRGTLTIFDNNKIVDVREFASVAMAIPTYDGRVVYG